MVIWVAMKTTIEIPDPLFRKVKSTAAERDQTLKEFFTEALQEKLASTRPATLSDEPAWMQGFGKLRDLRGETARVMKRIDDAFGRVEDEDRE